jgi:hypothetical protein
MRTIGNLPGETACSDTVGRAQRFSIEGRGLRALPRGRVASFAGRSGAARE